MKTILKNKDSEIEKPLYSVKQIFIDFWALFASLHSVRDVEREEVEKMLSCKEGAFFACYCKLCNVIRIVSFGCNSRLCSRCGKRHTDRWAKRLVKRLFPGKIHRHLVFGMPDMLWSFIKENRKLQKIVMDITNKTIQELFNEISKKKNKTTSKIKVGVIAVLHTFGKDIEYKPHVHCIVTEGGFTNKGIYLEIGFYIDYDALHRKWQRDILEALKPYIHKSVIDLCFRKYTQGFCAYVKPERLKCHKRLIEYIGRYLRHPVIANSRIDYYDGRIVRFWYKNAEDNIYHKQMFVDDFIGSIIQHIPDKHEKLVRYYGSYARLKRRNLFKQLTIIEVISSSRPKNRRIPCPICKSDMEILAYCDKPPPKDKELITNWIK